MNNRILANISIATGLFGFLAFPLLFGPVAAVTGFIARRKTPPEDVSGLRMASVGLALGVIQSLIAFAALACAGLSFVLAIVMGSIS